MNNLELYSKIGLRVAGVIFLGCLSFSCLSLRATVKGELESAAIHAHESESKLINGYAAIATELNNPKRGLPQLLWEATSLTRESRQLVDVSNKTALKEKDTIFAISESSKSLVTKANDAVDSLNSDAQSLKSAIIQMSADFTLIATQAKANLVSLQALTDDPDIKSTIKHVDAATGQIVGISTDFHAMSTDAKVKLHIAFFPPKTPWYKKAGGEVPTAVRLFVAMHSFGAY